VEKTYGRKGRRIAELNYRAIDKTLASLQQSGGAGPISLPLMKRFTPIASTGH
jgi:hypothetical protein